ncbi:hypothetical protein HI914_02217 [Erysiphe necator]|nr:hypothetical protein HI914_02217 [Erysiphe necator]
MSTNSKTEKKIIRISILMAGDLAKTASEEEQYKWIDDEIAEVLKKDELLNSRYHPEHRSIKSNRISFDRISNFTLYQPTISTTVSAIRRITKILKITIKTWIFPSKKSQLLHLISQIFHNIYHHIPQTFLHYNHFTTLC